MPPGTWLPPMPIFPLGVRAPSKQGFSRRIKLPRWSGKCPCLTPGGGFLPPDCRRRPSPRNCYLSITQRIRSSGSCQGDKIYNGAERVHGHWHSFRPPADRHHGRLTPQRKPLPAGSSPNVKNSDLEQCTKDHAASDAAPQAVHPLGSRAKVLLTSVFGPYGQDDEYGSRQMNPMELYHNQVTRTQGAFSLADVSPQLGHHADPGKHRGPLHVAGLPHAGPLHRGTPH